MKTRYALMAALMLICQAMPVAQAQSRGFGRYANSPVHTAFGVYPYSYSNPAFRAGGGTVGGTDAFLMRQMQSQQMQAMQQQQRAAQAQQKAMLAAAEKANKAKATGSDKNGGSATIAAVSLQQPQAPHLKSKQELARERARKREAGGQGKP